MGRDSHRYWKGGKKKQKCFRYWHFGQVVQFLHLLPCCSECSVTAFEPKICNCFFQYIMCLLAEGSYPQGLAVTYFQALAQEVNIVQLKSSRHSRVDLSYHTLYGWVLWFSRYLPTSKNTPFLPTIQRKDSFLVIILGSPIHSGLTRLALWLKSERKVFYSIENSCQK